MRTVTLALALALALAACGGSDGGGDVPATDVRDVAPPDSSDVAPDPGPADPGGDAQYLDNEWGFPMRLPQKHAFAYTPAWGGDPQTIEVLDADWLCTYARGDLAGVAYLQTTPVRVEAMGMSTNPVFEGRNAWMWVGGALNRLDNPYYDWGGNHHNEYLEWDQGEEHVKVWHSSIGPGYRVCHTPDCLQIYDLKETLVEDGCEPERTLPVTCSPVKEDGTWEPLVDTFAPCEGAIR